MVSPFSVLALGGAIMPAVHTQPKSSPPETWLRSSHHFTIQIPSQILLKFFHFRPDFIQAGVLAERAPQSRDLPSRLPKTEEKI
jgi:hypothetical protein